MGQSIEARPPHTLHHSSCARAACRAPPMPGADAAPAKNMNRLKRLNTGASLPERASVAIMSQDSWHPARVLPPGTTRRTCDAQDGRRPDGRVGAGLDRRRLGGAGRQRTIAVRILRRGGGRIQWRGRACGASEPDLKQHQDTSRKNLQRYAQEYGFNAQNYDTLRQGLDQGKAMMEEMKRSGVDGCRGVLGSFQNERVIGYEDMKAAWPRSATACRGNREIGQRHGSRRPSGRA